MPPSVLLSGGAVRFGVGGCCRCCGGSFSFSGCIAGAGCGCSLCSCPPLVSSRAGAAGAGLGSTNFPSRSSFAIAVLANASCHSISSATVARSASSALILRCCCCSCACWMLGTVARSTSPRINWLSSFAFIPSMRRARLCAVPAGSTIIRVNSPAVFLSPLARM